MARYGRYVLVTILLLLIQTSLIPFVALVGVTPDLVLVYVAVVALKEGQLRGTVAGFLMGLAGDLVTGNFFGLGALSKTIAGFTAGFFHNEISPEAPLGNYTFLITVAVTGLIHNAIYNVVGLQGLGISMTKIFFTYIIGSTLYTLLVALVSFFFFGSKMRSIG